MDHLIAALLAVLAPAAVPIGEGPPAPVVDVRSLSIIHPLPEGKGKGLGGWKTGFVNVELAVRFADREVTGVDVKGSTLRRFEDDKGTPLVKAGGTGWLSPFLRLGFRGALPVDLSSDSLPAPGATAIRLDADVALRCGAGRRTLVAEGLKLRAGERRALDPAEVEVKEERERLVVWVRGPKHLIKVIEVRDEQGRRFAQSYGGGGINDGQEFTARGYAVPPGATAATVRIEGFAATSVVLVPVRVNIDLAGPTPLRP